MLTLANDQLGPSGWSAANRASTSRRRATVTVRATWFDNRVKNPVSNVTIGTNLQQRQNLGRTRITGCAERRRVPARSRCALSGGYLFNHAKVDRVRRPNPALGRSTILPQVPKHRGSVRRVVLESALRERRRHRQFYRPAVRRRPQNERTKPGETGAGPAGVRSAGRLQRLARLRPQPRSVLWRAEPVSIRSTIVAAPPTTTGSPRLINGGIRVRFSGR